MLGSEDARNPRSWRSVRGAVQKSPDPQPSLLPFAGNRWKPRRLRPIAGSLAQAADLLILSGAYLGIVLLPYLRRVHGSVSGVLQLSVSVRIVLVAALCVSTWRMIFVSVGLYTPQRTRSLMDYLLRCLIGLNSCTLVVGLIEVVLHSPASVWVVCELFWAVALGCMVLVRGMLLFRAGRARSRKRRTLIVVGSGQRAREVYAELEAHAEWDYQLLGFVDSEPQGGFVPAGMILGGIDDLEKILTQTVVDEVMIALPMKSQYEAVGYSIAVCQMLSIQSQYFTEYFGSASRTPHANRNRPGEQAALQPRSGSAMVEPAPRESIIPFRSMLDRFSKSGPAEE